MKLKCKKTYPSLIVGMKDVFIKDNEYEVVGTDSQGVIILNEHNRTNYFKYSLNVELFNLCLYDYFYSTQELRKMKIDNLIKKEV